MDDYRLIANRIAEDISAGRMRAGDRLPPQRQFARRHRIAASTATRVYSELTRRGLVVGEVGRGTFVRATKPLPEPALAEPSSAPVDLELNFSVLPELPALLGNGLQRLSRPDMLARAMAPPTSASSAPARAAVAEFLSGPHWTVSPDSVLLAGSGRQAIAAAIAALVPTGERLGVEAITYPVVKAIASRLGVTLVPLATDRHGLTPQALKSVQSLRAIYVQSAIHNPLGVSMTAQRRAELAEITGELGLPVIEDRINAFLQDDPPLAALAPEHTVVVDSLSKRLAAGLSLGFAVAPPFLIDRLSSATRSGWAPQNFAVHAAQLWLTDGTVAAVQQARRTDAAARQRLVAEHLAGFEVHADPRAYHCWWVLPEPWRADTFVAEAARHGIAVTPAAAFTVGGAHAPNAVRLAIAAPPVDTLASALVTLAGIARGRPDDAAVD